MNYGFLIDQRTCIGCHACSVACKSENEVPLGVYRTWVKYVEQGAFPNTRRHFQVTRCNHCANPPCVRICPVTAMYQRDDGIVEFDPRVCIGCKACMQACPYDAIYIDPATRTAAKCHFCSHRTELGLEPACVIVCPERAIIAGDLDDPASEISRLVAREKVSVRKPEQGTSPKLFYIDADEVTLTPTAPYQAGTFMWAEVIPLHAAPANGKPASGTLPAVARAGTGRAGGHAANPGPATARSGVPIRTPAAQGLGYRGPIFVGESRVAEHMVQTGYNVQHRIPWHWPVPAYLVTKGIASGVFTLLALLFGLNLVPFNRPLALLGGLVSLLFTGLTTLLLVVDLDRPWRFYTILTRPQWRSWLTRGAFLLLGFSAIAALWVVVEAGAPAGLAGAVRPFLLLAGFVLAVGAAIYTAFLFGQAEGRDLWQSALLPAHLVIQALLAGSVTLLLLGLVAGLPPRLVVILAWVFGLALVVDLFVILLGELAVPHASETAARAAHAIRSGRFRRAFWFGAIGLGHLLPLLFLAAGVILGYLSPVLLAGMAAAALAGLYLYEYVFVMAPQEVPNS